MSTKTDSIPSESYYGSGHITQFTLWKQLADTSMGDPDEWPLALKYAINTLFANPSPSFICWGNNKFFYYNDAFAAFFLNQEIAPKLEVAGPIVFGEYWDKVSAAVLDAFENRGAIVKNVRISGQGPMNERCLDISIGSIFDLNGEIMGASGVCQERTFEWVAGDMLRANKQYLKSLIAGAQIGICVIANYPLKMEEVNDAFLRLLGFGESSPKVLHSVLRLLGGLNVLENNDGPLYRKEVPHLQLYEGQERKGYIDVMVAPYTNRQGKIGGVSVMLVDVTDQVNAQNELSSSNEELQAINEELDQAQRKLEISLQKLTEREHQIRQMITHAPYPIALYVGADMVIAEANRAIIDLWGKGPNVLGKKYKDVLPELDGQFVFEQLKTVFDTGLAFQTQNQRLELAVAGQIKTFYFNYSFTPLFDEKGKVYGVMNNGVDVTDLISANQRVLQGESNFRSLIMQAPVAMCLLEGPKLKIRLANEAMVKIWGRKLDDVLGRPIFDALPDASAQGLEEAMDQVYRTGKPFFAAEQPISLLRHNMQEVVYQNFVYQPFRNGKGEITGIIAISVDVTDTVLARKGVENAFGRLNLAVEAASLGMFDYDLKHNKLEWDERCKSFFGLVGVWPISYQEHFIGGIHPDDRAGVLAAIDKATNIDSAGDYDQEFRSVAFDTGEVRWLRGVGKVYFNRNNLAERLVGTVTDMTQAKLSELKELEAVERRSRLAAIVDSSDDVIISKNLDGIVTSWNSAAERMFGYTANDAIGRHISLIIPEGRLDEEQMIISRIRAGKKVERFDSVRIASDGSERQLSITVSPILDPTGKVIGASKIARDISTQVAAKKATALYTERVEAISLVINTISQETDPNTIIQRVVQLAMHLLDAPVGMFLASKEKGKSLGYYLSPLACLNSVEFENVSTKFKELIIANKIKDTGRLNLQELDLNGKIDGKKQPLANLLYGCITASDGKKIGELYFVHHQSDYFTEDHEDLLTAILGHLTIGIDKAILYEKVMELNKKKDEFISLASHELKTPLAVISGYIQILSRMVKDELNSKYLVKTSLQINKLTSLVGDLLDVSKIEAGKLRFRLTDMDLLQILKGSLEMMREMSEGYQIDFAYQEGEYLIKGDVQRIEQVVTNLMTNAIKYAPGSNRIAVTLQIEAEMATVSVQDFGIGIPEEKIANLFSRFYRVNEETSNISGLGIGLYLSKEIVKRHCGKIWVESTAGEGSTFSFSLPLLNKTIMP